MGLFGPSYDKLVDKGKEALNADDLVRAEDFFLKAIRKDPNRPRAHGWLGMTYVSAANADFMAGDTAMQQKSLERALRPFFDAARLESDAERKAEDYWQMASALRLLHRDDTATLAEVEKASPGFTARRRDENTEALKEAFKKVSQESPQETNSH